MPIQSTPGHIWDGERQLPGTLELWERQVIFRPVNFKDSHLSLVIELSEIDSAEEYLVFDLARNGLRIQSKNGKCDLFVLEETRMFKNALMGQIGHLSK